MTEGELLANGTSTSSTERVYTDYIPVSEGDIIKIWRVSHQLALYRRHVTLYDASKNVISGGTDSATNSGFTVPSGTHFVRLTLDSISLQVQTAIVRDGVLPTKYTTYFDPYYELTKNFITPEFENVIQNAIKRTETYGFAFPHNTKIRMTVGIPMKWYNYSMVTPTTLYPNVSIGSQNSDRENDGIVCLNTTSVTSVNGYIVNVYDDSLHSVFKDYGPNGYGWHRYIIEENLQDCTVLVIGDSTVDFDSMTQFMLDYFSSKSKTLTLLGTLGSGTNRNEGRAGWKATDYLTNNRVYNGVINPFYNPTTEIFDFSYYMTNQNYSNLDYVIIQLGINDLYNSSADVIEPTWMAIKTMIDSILDYNASLKIILNLPTTPNSDQSKHSTYLPLYQNRVVRYNQYVMEKATEIYGSSKVRCSYCHLILDPATDIRDSVHPTNAGFEKMAKEIISQINVWQNGY